jgi:hypothetical protein
MRRLLVYLTETQHRRLAALATSLGVSKAQLIRDGIDLLLRREARRGNDPLLDLVGQAGPMGQSHPAAQHDSDQSSLFSDTERT